MYLQGFYVCILSAVTFDIPSPAHSVQGQDVEYDPAISEKKTPSREWELDVRSLISTKKWLQNYGLRKNKLTLKQILPTIGFKHSDGRSITPC